MWQGSVVKWNTVEEIYVGIYKPVLYLYIVSNFMYDVIQAILFSFVSLLAVIITNTF
jgi:hypothetical protein